MTPIIRPYAFININIPKEIRNEHEETVRCDFGGKLALLICISILK